MNVVTLNSAMERQARKNQLIDLIREKHLDKPGIILWIGGFEVEKQQFEQASSFYYFFDIEEPACFIGQEIGGKTILFLPRYSIDRAAWLPQKCDVVRLQEAGIDHVKGLGKAIAGCTVKPFFKQDQIEDLLAYLKEKVAAGDVIFAATSDVSVEQEWVLHQIKMFEPSIEKALISIDEEIAVLRRRKSEQELEYLYAAAEVTTMAQEAASMAIKPGNFEADVQAAVEFVFTQSGARKAFTTIVGSGMNSTILHYNDNTQKLPVDGVVVVDCGAMVNHYCSDVTRTYPVSGKFSKRHKQVYNDVLTVQKKVAHAAKAGMYLKNKDYPELCLNTLARRLFSQMGYNIEKDFPHSIGHYVGLDVHDVGSYKEPLAEGDIITIEPGIYLKEEQMGIRIEDVYWITQDGNVCITDSIPKEIEEVEELIRYSHKSSASVLNQ